MKVIFNDLLIVRDPNFHIPRKAPLWEVAILQEIYDQGSVVIEGEFVHDMTFSDVESEHARLNKIYGREEDSKIPFVEVVYGRGPAGLKALEKAIEASRVEEEAKRGPGRPKKEEAA